MEMWVAGGGGARPRAGSHLDHGRGAVCEGGRGRRRVRGRGSGATALEEAGPARADEGTGSGIGGNGT